MNVYLIVYLFDLTGAHDQNWTGDLILTKDALFRLSYAGIITKVVGREGFEPSKAFSQRIYSPLHLTTLVPPHYSRISYLLAYSVQRLAYSMINEMLALHNLQFWFSSP